MSLHEAYVKKSLKELKYMFYDITKKEVVDIVNYYKGLAPKVADFVFHNGTTKKLMSLRGTVPMFYKQATYHIPIEIWLLETYPANAPMVYVRPTSNMSIKVSKYVDDAGKIYLPILHTWNKDDRNYGGLRSLIQVLIYNFQELPPVFSLPNPPTVAPVPYPSTQSNPPYPSYTSPYPPMPLQTPMQHSNNSNSSATITPHHIRLSLISALGDKVRRRFEDIYFPTQVESKTGEELKRGTDKLEEIVRKLEREKEIVRQNIKVLETEIKSLDEKIEKRVQTEESSVSIDDVVQAPAPLYKQMVNLFVEEAAVEDTIYYLSEGFRGGKLDFETFQKVLRTLARKQFMLRATLRKCRQKAGLL